MGWIKRPVGSTRVKEVMGGVGYTGLFLPLHTPYGRSLATRVTVPSGHFGLRRDGKGVMGGLGSLGSCPPCVSHPSPSSHSLRSFPSGEGRTEPQVR